MLWHGDEAGGLCNAILRTHLSMYTILVSAWGRSGYRLALDCLFGSPVSGVSGWGLLGLCFYPPETPEDNSDVATHSQLEHTLTALHS